MNKYTFLALVAFTFCSFAEANKPLWDALNDAHEFGTDAHWEKVALIIKTDPTVKKYYAPKGKENVYWYLLINNRFDLIELIEETSDSVIEPEVDEQSLIVPALQDAEDEPAPDATVGRVRAFAIRAVAAASATHVCGK